mmetsp:Transcript_15178/g.33960  ORF Transcript_15178/g.33960 Transcript_15178/m.33960 type:complete len:317 (+) Transcript_15178:239-1189(+)
MCDLSTPHPRASRRPRVRRRSFPILLVASLLALARARVSPDGSPDPLASEGEQLSRLRSSWGSAFDEIRSLGGRNATEEGVDNRHLAARMANVVRVKTPVPVIPAPAREGEAVLPDTDLGDPTKRIWIVTSASLPWMTGTAVNPLLRAAQLTRGRKGEGSVTLMLPWLEKASDRQRVYGNADKFSLPEEQEEDVRRWLRETAGMADAAERLRIRWYAAWLERAENSIYSTGDIIGTIPVSLELSQNVVRRHVDIFNERLSSIRRRKWTSASWKNRNISTGIGHLETAGPANLNTSSESCTPTIFSMPWNSPRQCSG